MSLSPVISTLVSVKRLLRDKTGSSAAQEGQGMQSGLKALLQTEFSQIHMLKPYPERQGLLKGN